MNQPIDSGLEFYRQVLDLRGFRQQILTADIANASTPEFKAVDLDFSAALATAAGAPAGRAAGAVWLVDDARHLAPGSVGAGSAIAPAVEYQTGTAVTLDGNSVDLNREKVAAGENAVQYEAAASFAAQLVKMMAVAINGSGASQTGGG